MDLIYEGITTSGGFANRSVPLVRMDLIYEGITTQASPLLSGGFASQNGPDLRRDYDD